MMRRVLGTAVVAMAVAGSSAVLASPARAGGFVAADESRVQDRVDATRQSKGLGTLVRNDQLVQMARGQSVRQADKGSIFHNSDLGGEITRRGLDWQKVGENVGMGPNVNLIEEAFLASPHHYENIVDPKFDAIGVGVVDGSDGRRYVTQVFADLAPSVPPLTMTQPAVAKAASPVAPTAAPTVAPTATPTGPTLPSATAQPSAPAKPAPAKPSPEPNVVVGGVVEPLDLRYPGFDQAKRTGERIEASGVGPVDRFIDFVTFWS